MTSQTLEDKMVKQATVNAFLFTLRDMEFLPDINIGYFYILKEDQWIPTANHRE